MNQAKSLDLTPTQTLQVAPRATSRGTANGNFGAALEHHEAEQSRFNSQHAARIGDRPATAKERWMERHTQNASDKLNASGSVAHKAKEAHEGRTNAGAPSAEFGNTGKDSASHASKTDKFSESKVKQTDSATDSNRLEDLKKSEGSKNDDHTVDGDTQEPLDPQAALALMLSTNAPVADLSKAGANAEALANAEGDVDALNGNTASAANAGMTAVDAEQGQSGATTSTNPAHANGQSQTTNLGAVIPAGLAIAAKNLGPIKVQVDQALEGTNESSSSATAQAGAESLPAAVPDLDATSIVFAKKDSDGPEDGQPQNQGSDDLSLTTTANHSANEIKAEQAAKSADSSESSPTRDVMKQILDRAEQIKGAQQNAVKLQLYPEHLGKMEIRVVAHQGVISAQLMADSQQTKSLLDGQLAQLQRSFAEMGLKVDRVEVTLSSANLDFNGGNTSFGGFSQQQQGDAQRQFAEQAPRQSSGLGYEQWIPESASETTPNGLAETAINYVA